MFVAEMQYIGHLQVHCIDMAAPLVKDLKLLETNGVQAFDAHLRACVLVVARVICISLTI